MPKIVFTLEKFRDFLKQQISEELFKTKKNLWYLLPMLLEFKLLMLFRLLHKLQHFHNRTISVFPKVRNKNYHFYFDVDTVNNQCLKITL